MLNRVYVDIQDNGLICIHNQSGGMGETLVVDAETTAWLARAIERFLQNFHTREQHFTDDHLRVEVGGRDHDPEMALFNRRIWKPYKAGVKFNSSNWNMPET